MVNVETLAKLPTIAGIINENGGLGGLVNDPKEIVVSGRSLYMDLSIQYLGNGPNGYPMIAVSHSYEQNGDLMMDPSMEFEVLDHTRDGLAFFPVSFQQDNLGIRQTACFRQNEKVFTNHQIVVSQVRFARQWDKNLKSQGFDRAAVRVRNT